MKLKIAVLEKLFKLNNNQPFSVTTKHAEELFEIADLSNRSRFEELEENLWLCGIQIVYVPNVARYGFMRIWDIAKWPTVTHDNIHACKGEEPNV